MAKYSVFSGDSGLPNFALAVLEWPTKTSKALPIVVFSGFFEGLIANFTKNEVVAKLGGKKITYKGFNRQLEIFQEVAMTYLFKYHPDEMVFERFQSRGIRGKTIEAVSMMNMGFAMIGLRMKKKIPTTLVTASEWKNQINRVLAGTSKEFKTAKPMDVIYAECKAMKIQPHHIDSVLIGIYRFNKELFSCLKPAKQRALLYRRMLKAQI